MLSYLAAHYAEKITLSELAAAAGCSVTYLSRCFRLHTGASPYRHLIELRLSEACRLLLGGKSVTDTCFAVGFENCSNFIRIFRQELGITPLRYRLA